MSRDVSSCSTWTSKSFREFCPGEYVREKTFLMITEMRVLDFESVESTRWEFFDTPREQYVVSGRIDNISTHFYILCIPHTIRIRTLALLLTRTQVNSSDFPCLWRDVYGLEDLRLNEVAEHVFPLLMRQIRYTHSSTFFTSNVLFNRILFVVRCQNRLPRGERTFTKKKKHEDKNSDVVDMTLHLIPNRKTYVHRGIVLRDEKDLSR